jgi:peptidoglycan/xylan/chitin deacetylase (PgdA/CDA1 family)
VVVLQALLVALDVLTCRTSSRRGGAGDLAEAQVGVLQRLAQRDDDVARLQRAAGRPWQQRRVEHEVDVVDERDARAVRRQDALERPGCVEAAEAAARDDDVPGHACHATGLMVDHGERSSPRIALTFDDGPGPDTPAVLDALAGTPATFFLHGAAIAAQPDVVRRIHREGHELANHALTHTPLRRRPLAALREAQVTQRRIAALTGVRPLAFRPPYGAGGAAVAALGLHVVGWDVDPRDWSGVDARTIADRVLARLRPGAIVLLHDGRGDRSQTAAAIPRILEASRTRALQPVTVSELLGIGT